MGQKYLFVVVAGLLIAGGWSVGRAQRNVAAQGNVADFEMSIETPPGSSLTVRCYRGCDWPESVDGTSVASFECESEPCRWTFNGYGIILLVAPSS